MHHMHNKTSSDMLNVEFISKRLRNMGDQWEARISAMENIQEEFGHDIQEMREQLVRLTNSFENHIKIEAVHPRGLSPSSNQQVPRPFIQTTSHLSRGTYRPNLR